MNDFKKDIIKLSSILNEESEFIPLITPEDEENMEKEAIPSEISLLPIRNNVLFPGVVIPITIGRDKSIKLIEDANNGTKIIGVVSQKNGQIENPTAKDLNKIGTIAQILKTLKMPDGSSTVIIQGKRRFELETVITEEPYFKAKVKPFNDGGKSFSVEANEALLGSLKDLATNIIKQSPNVPSEAAFAIKNIDSPSFLVNFISSNMGASVEDKQQLLELSNLQERANKLLGFLTKELQLLEMKNEIQSKVKVDIDKQQREYFLHQQIKTIQDELGDNPVQMEVEELKKKASKKKWGKKVAVQFEKELSKLERMNPSAAEFNVQLNYCQTLIGLPWKKVTKDKYDLKRAKEILDRDHFGLDKVKERIIEYLAVLKLKKDLKAPILCLQGPPGVGKTSLGKSIAEALGRKYVRMSLGGVRDEAEIRGHRRTYIGAMPGRVLQNLKKAGTSNPVFVLDEIDKISRDSHGDPSSALLEVLDPEQNTAFNDNYVELDYDLSKVLFVATSNSLYNIQSALRDRMEIIHVSGYTLEEKVEIAKRHLVPKQLKENGVKAEQISFEKGLLEFLVSSYTSESGVRKLEQRIGKVIRYRAKQIALEENYKKQIKIEVLPKIFGKPYTKDKYEGNDKAGVVTGLAWTRVGGDILFIETSLTNGKGSISMTGNLGKVMKESATIAMEYLTANPGIIGLKQEDIQKKDVHIHIPEGATPKDGPSAGITMLTALASAYTGRKVKKNLAMTGEISLRGKVLPVGGIKEKILAAKRAGIKEIILCDQNKRDIDEIEARYLKGLKFHYVTKMEDVLKIALLKQKAKKKIA